MPPLAMPSSLSRDSHCSSSDLFAHANAKMVEPGSAFVKGFRSVRIGEVMDPDQRLPTQQPDHMVERPGVFIDDGRTSEESFVPGPTPTQITDGQRDVGDARKFRHASLLEMS